jgi:hypothetical protein
MARMMVLLSSSSGSAVITTRGLGVGCAGSARDAIKSEIDNVVQLQSCLIKQFGILERMEVDLCRLQSLAGKGTGIW